MPRLAVVLALVALAPACKTVADGKQFETEIESQLAAKGVKAEVTCPAKIPLGMVEDNHFDCTVIEENGARTPVEVKLDEKGAWRLEAKVETRDPTE